MCGPGRSHAGLVDDAGRGGAGAPTITHTAATPQGSPNATLDSSASSASVRLSPILQRQASAGDTSTPTAAVAAVAVAVTSCLEPGAGRRTSLTPVMGGARAMLSRKSSLSR